LLNFASEAPTTFVGLHLALPTSQKLLNSAKKWGKIWGVWSKRVQCSVMGEFKQIKISSLKVLIFASLSMESIDRSFVKLYS
jgi:hypothetical protein